MDPFLSVGDRAVVQHNVCHLWQKQKRQEDERVSQALLGETVTVRELSDDRAWVRVEGEDTYRGWCERRWLAPVGEATPQQTITSVFADLLSAPDSGANLRLRLSIASRLTVLGVERDWAEVVLPGGLTGWLPLASVAPLVAPSRERIGASAGAYAGQFLGTPYLWGGSSAFGLDCSGLVQLCYRLAGVVLRRDADIQRTDTRFAPVGADALCLGDLVFFGTPARITHVGMHYHDNSFIHSAGGAGVIVTEWGDERYSGGFVDARRLLPECASQPVVRHEEENR